ncbi:M50 family metallopeptidase [Terricaulis sp.]|uniref:M50 family metallopeptidase n=1 Tax=Terricaulis sp. TaxID=2768686 RepID=UPI00378477D4
MNILSNIAIYAGAFVVVLSVVVFVHEFGHFQVARWRKVAIDTFSIGFGKTLLGWRDKQGVQWKIGALPLGGYVKFTDDADAMSTGPVEQIEDPAAKAEARRKGLFHAQPLDTRAMVVAAGPVTNFIFSIFAFALVFFIMGNDVTDVSRIPARIATVGENTAAARAGLRPGDVVRSVDGVAIANFDELRAIVAGAPERTLALQVERGGQTLTLSATPSRAAQQHQNIQTGQGQLGVSGPMALESERVVVKPNPLEAIGMGAQRTWEMVAQTFGYIGGVFAGRESGNQIAGPLGIINVSGQVATSALDTPDATLPQRLQMLGLSLLTLAAILSVAVGIVNLLPIPILDGGHLLFYLIEGLRGGRPLPPAAQEWAYRAGFAVMASLFLFATWNDITRLLPIGAR